MVDNNFGFTPLDQQPTYPPGPHDNFGFKPIEDTHLKPDTSPTFNDQGSNNLSTIPAAIVGGMSTGAGNIANAAVDGGAWLLQKMGAISPNTKKQIEGFMDNATKITQVVPNAKGDVFERARADHPWLSSAGEYGVDAAGLLAAPAAKISSVADGAGALAKAGSWGLNQLGNMALNAPIAAGSSGLGQTGSQKQDSQDIGATMAATLTPIIGAAGSALSSFANKKLLPTNILNQVMEPINQSLLDDGSKSFKMKSAQSVANKYQEASKINDGLFQNIKNIPGTIETAPLKDQSNFLLKQANIQQAGDQLDTTSSLLNKPQTNVLMNIQQAIPQVKTMDDALALKQTLSQGFSKFKGGQTTDAIYDTYMNMMKHVDDQIGAKAADAGLSSDYQATKNFYKSDMIPLNNLGAPEISKAVASGDIGAVNSAMKGFLTVKDADQLTQKLKGMDTNGSKIFQQQFLSNIFGDIVHSPNALNPNNALLQTNRIISKYGSALGQDANDTLQGVKKLLENAGAVSGKPGVNLGSSIASHMAGHAAGGALGYMAGGVPGSVVGGIVGPAVISKIMDGVNMLLDSPTGVKMLQGVGQGKPWHSNINKLLTLGIPATLNQ